MSNELNKNDPFQLGIDLMECSLQEILNYATTWEDSNTYVRASCHGMLAVLVAFWLKNGHPDEIGEVLQKAIAAARSLPPQNHDTDH